MWTPYTLWLLYASVMATTVAYASSKKKNLMPQGTRRLSEHNPYSRYHHSPV